MDSYVPFGQASEAPGHLVTEDAVECTVPCSLGIPRIQGFLWHRGTKGKWQRRYCVCGHNFIVMFSEREAAVLSRPLAAICFD